ncbi:MAG TPA: hypothetical protein VF782_03120 [Allosphingosinicella sp.]|jgi:hypothetical protein
MLRRGGIVAALLAGIYGCAGQGHSYRYRLTVDIETPQGVRTGSTVREIQWIPQGSVSATEFTTRQRGEAVAVDLPGGQTLFVLMDTDGHETIRAAVGQGAHGDVKTLLDRAAADREVYVYPPAAALRSLNLSYPRLVRFRDLADPKTAEFVQPDDLASTFGPGVSLKRIALQIVDEPISNEIPKRLPWRTGFPKGKLNGDRFEDFSKREAAAHLSAFSFSTEPVK